MTTTTPTAIAKLSVEPCVLSYAGIQLQGGKVLVTEVTNPPQRWAIILTAADGEQRVLQLHERFEDAEDQAKVLRDDLASMVDGEWFKAPEGPIQ